MKLFLVIVKMGDDIDTAGLIWANTEDNVKEKTLEKYHLTDYAIQFIHIFEVGKMMDDWWFYDGIVVQADGSVKLKGN